MQRKSFMGLGNTSSNETCRVVCLPRMLLVISPIRCNPKASASPCKGSVRFGLTYCALRAFLRLKFRSFVICH